ncbi:MAG: hypothetical protein R2712_03345 [Vicinamibacterales bacterium]
MDALGRHRALRLEDGSTADAAAVSFNLLNAELTRAEARPVQGGRERLVSMAQATVAETRDLQRPYVEAQAHRVLADLLRTSEPARGGASRPGCVTLEGALEYPPLRAECPWSRAPLECRRNPTRAEALSRQAIALTAGEHDAALAAFAWQARLRLVWDTLDPASAEAESLAALDAIERLRAAQAEEHGRATLFGNWTRDYHWLADASCPPRRRASIARSTSASGCGRACCSIA